MLQSSCMANMLGNPLADPFVYECVYIVCVCRCMRVSVCLLVFALSQLASGRWRRAGGAQDQHQSESARRIFSMWSFEMGTNHFKSRSGNCFHVRFLVSGSSCRYTDVVLAQCLLGMCVSHAHHLPVPTEKTGSS